MRTKKKQNSKVSKSAKTRLSDLTPKKDAGGGAVPTPPLYFRPKSLTSVRRQSTV
jgi:hypothetical protein